MFVCGCACGGNAYVCLCVGFGGVGVVVAVCVCVGRECGLYTSHALNRKCKRSTDVCVCVTAVLRCVYTVCV